MYSIHVLYSFNLDNTLNKSNIVLLNTTNKWSTPKYPTNHLFGCILTNQQRTRWMILTSVGLMATDCSPFQPIFSRPRFIWPLPCRWFLRERHAIRGVVSVSVSIRHRWPASVDVPRPPQKSPEDRSSVCFRLDSPHRQLEVLSPLSPPGDPRDLATVHAFANPVRPN